VRADRLDEGLEIVTGLWSGQPFSFSGRYYEVAETVFEPRPVQTPRIPIWVGGRWPSRRPFRRAARFDGVFPTFEGIGHTDRPSPEQLGEVVDYVRGQRGDETFDVIVEAQSEGPDRQAVAGYEAVGLTWWIEKLGWFRGPLDYVRERIQAGPPTG
jgi:alkanesulfonate monooxygenase SsuD/methylene tetrahydromethanopterin reductase-like flavin-dependent oxidoreductase (luciferase family)